MARAIAERPTGIAAFIGTADQGPIGRPVACRSRGDHDGAFGAPGKHHLEQAVAHFFAQGGRRCLMLRLTGLSAAELAGDGRTTGAFALAAPFDLLAVPGCTDAAALAALAPLLRANGAMLLADSAQGSADDPAPMAGAPDPALLAAFGADAAQYYPWIISDDQPSRTLPPSGAVAGVIARTDATRGPWKAPAGMEATLAGVRSPAVRLNDEQQGRLNPLGVNCIRTFPGKGVVVWGARTVAGADALASEGRYIPVQRVRRHLERSVADGLRWTAVRRNDERLWSEVRLAVGVFLDGLWRRGAFQGTTAHESYFVRCDTDTTTAADMGAGSVGLEIGFAPLKPAEFIVLRLQLRARRR